MPKTVLHVGCGLPSPEKLPGNFRKEDWREVRLDIDPGVQPDIVASIVNMAVVASDSVDAIWSSHNLEHLYPHEVPAALKEFLRVLKPGGFVLITLPDIQAVAEHVAQGKLHEPLYTSPAGPICALDVLYGFRPALALGNLFMAHHTAFTGKSLGEAFVAAGFHQVKVKRGEHFDLWAEALKRA